MIYKKQTKLCMKAETHKKSTKLPKTGGKQGKKTV